jgi:serine/threonine protein kinase
VYCIHIYIYQIFNVFSLIEVCSVGFKEMATDILNAVLMAAQLVKQTVEDASANTTTSKALRERIELVLRVLASYPHPQKLDDRMMGNLLRLLKESHAFVVSYKNYGKMSRVLNATSIKKRFDELDSLIGKALDDLTLCVVVASAGSLEEIRAAIAATSPTTTAETDADVKDILNSFLLKFEDLVFDFDPACREKGRNELARGSFGVVYTASCTGDTSSLKGMSPHLKYTVKEFYRGYQTNEACNEFVSLVASLRGSDYVGRVFGGGSLVTPTSPASSSSNQRDQSPTDNFRPFVVMDFHRGGSLFDVVMAESIAAEDQLAFVLKTGFGISSGLAYLHENQLVHGNLSPFHVVLDAAMTPKIVDFGYRVQQRRDIKVATQCPMDIELLSTQSLVWLAPEQVKGSATTTGAASLASDIYSLALVISFTLCGQLPYNFNASSNAGRINLLELIRNDEKKPKLVSFQHPCCTPVFQQILPLCLDGVISNRPSAAMIEKMIFGNCQELKLALPFIPSHLMPKDSLAVATGNVDEDSDDGMMSGFDEMTSQIETITDATRLFVAGSPQGKTAEQSFIAIYGNKVVLSGLRTAALVSNVVRNDQDDDEGVGGELVFDDNSCTGIVILHIDNTKSMSRENRMVLTKQVLQRIIPQLLRLGYRVIVNAWSVKDNVEGDKSMVVTRVVSSADTQALLSQDKSAELALYLETKVFDIFTTVGMTDLYGSSYQLIHQMKQFATVGQSKTVYAFLLTDGNHNLLTRPTHPPAQLNERYFEFKAVAGNGAGVLKWEGPKSQNDIKVASLQQYLKDEYGRVVESLGASDEEITVSLTLVGIGDADPQGLSTLARLLGHSTGFYGVTEVQHADAVFMRATQSAAASQVVSLVCGDRLFEFRYTNEENGCLDGVLTVEESSVLQMLHQAKELSVTFNSNRSTVKFTADEATADEKQQPVDQKLSQYLSDAAQVKSMVNDFMLSMKRVKQTAYTVSAESLVKVFKHLMDDKKVLQSIKGAYYGRQWR